jgi:triacylglycerol lipase
VANWTQHICLVQTIADYAFRHVQFWFNTDPMELISEQPFKGLLDLQRLGASKPTAPVFVESNRYDPVVPWGGVHQLALDWCARGADVEFWTNEQPPFQNKTGINHQLRYFVDGEQGMQWVADRFNGLPTTPNCAQI